MKLTRLSAQNLLSFDTFELELDRQRTVIVGPNGSGKTNVTRLLTLMGSALVWANREGPRGSAVEPGSAARILEGFAGARHLPDGGGRQVVRVAFELTEDWERDLMVAFLRAALLWSLLDGPRQGQQHSVPLAAWAMSSVTAAACTDLFSGTLIAEHPGIPGMNWEVGLEFAHGTPGTNYRWVLQTPSLHSAILTAQDATSPPAGIMAGSDVLTSRLLGIASGGPSLTSLPPLPQFSLDFLCPNAGEAIRLVVGERGQYLDMNLGPYNTFLKLARLPQPVAPAPGYSIATVLDHIYGAGLVLVGEQLRGVGTWGTALPRAGTYAWEELANPPVSREPHLVPLRLFHLKTGSAADKERYTRIQGGFRTLAPGRDFDLRFEAVSGQQPGGDASDVAQARIEVMVTKALAYRSPGSGAPAAEFPVQLHGAGTWEALILAEALNDAAGRVVVLDEPATTLHPSWQRSLATEMGQSDAQILLITHSPDLVRIRHGDDLKRPVRFSLEAGASVARRLASPPKQELANELLRELAMSADLRGCLFARGVVLLEGETELGALPHWFARCSAGDRTETPAALDLAFYSVGGDKRFTPPLALLAGLGVPWAIICDGAAFDVRRQDHIFHQVASAAADDGIVAVLPPDEVFPMDQATFYRIVVTGREHGILTLAAGWTTGDRAAGTPGDESFEVYLDQVLPGARDQARQAVGSSKVRQGIWIAEHHAPPEGISELYCACVRSLRDRGLAT